MVASEGTFGRKKRILILSVTGMLGHTLFRSMSKNGDFDVFGTARGVAGPGGFFSAEERGRIRGLVDADKFDTVVRAVASVQPDIIINCIGVIKQHPGARDPLATITTNAQLPHRISLLASAAKARMIHVSTDCVFSGGKGNYTEADVSDATDLYGRSKHLGEVEYPHCVTLRTSVIGHELRTDLSLIDWFLSQTGTIKGFTRAIYTGFPTVEMGRIIANYVIPNDRLEGTYHVSSDRISKCDLLLMVKEVYKKQIVIEPSDGFVIDRSLNSERFRQITGYVAPPWGAMVGDMYADFMGADCYSGHPYRRTVSGDS